MSDLYRPRFLPDLLLSALDRNGDRPCLFIEDEVVTAAQMRDRISPRARGRAVHANGDRCAGHIEDVAEDGVDGRPRRCGGSTFFKVTPRAFNASLAEGRRPYGADLGDERFGVRIPGRRQRQPHPRISHRLLRLSQRVTTE